MAAFPPLQPADIDSAPRASMAGEQLVGVEQGLQVRSHDDEILGHVGGFVIDVLGNLTSFHIRAGGFLTHDVRIPMRWVQSVTRDRIILRLKAAEVFSADIANRQSLPRRSG